MENKELDKLMGMRVIESILMPRKVTAPYVINEKTYKALKRAIKVAEKLKQQGKIESYEVLDPDVNYEDHTMDIVWSTPDGALIFDEEHIKPLRKLLKDCSGFFFADEIGKWQVFWDVYTELGNR